MKTDAHPFLSSFSLPTEFFSQGKKHATDVHFSGVKLPHPTFYLDYASSTPVHSAVFQEMNPWHTGFFGNPSARIHPMGEVAEHGLGQARSELAKILNAKFEDVFFVGSATEANNLFLRGIVTNPKRKRTKIVYAATEHSSIAVTAQALESTFGKIWGIKSVELPVDADGQIDLEKAKTLIDSETLCVCVMDANNETGVLQKYLPELVTLAHSVGAPIHIDAVQGFARGDFNTANLNYDSLVISSGKIYGPKGAACLVTRKDFVRYRIEAQLTGGGHEFDMRSSTPNLPAIRGFMKAAQLQQSERSQRNKHLASLETAFLKALTDEIDIIAHASSASRVPGILMIAIEGVNAMKLIEESKCVCVSVGSACRTLQATASHVLISMGVDLDIALASFRVSVGLPNTIEEVQEAARILARTAKQLRETSATLQR